LNNRYAGILWSDVEESKCPGAQKLYTEYHSAIQRMCCEQYLDGPRDILASIIFKKMRNRQVVRFNLPGQVSGITCGLWLALGHRDIHLTGEGPNRHK
jgi:hypothetical protein